MPLLPDISTPLTKPQRRWLLTEHFLFLPLCLFGLWQPLMGLAFIFSVFGIFCSRTPAFLPGPEQYRYNVARGLSLFYGAVLLASVLLSLWPLSGDWRRVSQSGDFTNVVLSNSDPLAVLHGGSNKIQVHELRGDSWVDLSYPGGHGWRMVSAEGELWIVPNQEASIYVLRNGSWIKFARPGGYCDSFEITDGTLWIVIESRLYQGSTAEVALSRVEDVPRARYVAARGDAVLVSDYRHWHQSEDSGQTWTNITPADVDYTAEPYLSRDGLRYWLVSGVFSSELYASSAGHPPIKRTVPVRDARVLVINPDDGKERWLGSWEGGVFRSLDGGETWLEMGLQRVQVSSMAVDFQRRLVFAASANLLFDKYIFQRSF